MPNVSKCQSLYSALVSRFQSENPSLVLSDTISSWLYQSIYSIYETSGEAEAERYVREAHMV